MCVSSEGPYGQSQPAVRQISEAKSQKVNSIGRYIERLIHENHSLQGGRSLEGPRHEAYCSSEEGAGEETTATSTDLPVSPDAAWFVRTDSLNTPILIGEGSDTGFSTRFRQAMSSVQHGHIPRVSYPSDDELLHMSDTECHWPDPTRARHLVDTCLKSIGRCYYMVRPSSVLHDLECAIQNPVYLKPMSTSRLWAMFAIGEMYNRRTSSMEQKFAGIEYFAQASKILHVICERPTLDMVETWLLLVSSSLPHS